MVFCALFASGVNAAILGAHVKGGTPGGMPFDFTQSTSTAPSAGVTGSSVGTLGAGEVLASALAEAQVGVLRVQSMTSGRAGASASGQFAAEGGASWVDSLTLDAAGRTGQLGTLSAAISVGGTLTVDFSGRAYSLAGVGASIDLFPGVGFNGGRTIISNGSTIDYGYQAPFRRQNNPSDEFILSFTVPFMYGRPIGLTAVLNTNAFSRLNSPDGESLASSVYSSTLYWQGISSVLDKDGNSVTDFTAVSSGGYDLSKAFVVPVPPALGLLAGALGTLAYASDRRRRQCAGTARSSA